MAPDDSGLVGVEVVYCPRPGVTDSTHLQLAAAATVAVALQASGVLKRHGLDAALLRVDGALAAELRFSPLAARRDGRARVTRCRHGQWWR